MFDSDENIGPPFLEGDGLAHVRSPHFIDLVGDDGSVVHLLLVAPDAMGLTLHEIVRLLFSFFNELRLQGI